jgi:hypothetical protein
VLLAIAPDIAMSEGGRARISFPFDETVALELVGLAPGFTARVTRDGARGRLVVGAPYGITGVLPAELVGSCADGLARALPVTLRVRPLTVTPLSADGAPAAPAPRWSPGLAVVGDRLVVVGGIGAGPGIARTDALDDAWAFDLAGDGGWSLLTTGAPAGVVRAAAVPRAVAARSVLLHDDAGRVTRLGLDGRLDPVVAAAGPIETGGGGFVRHATSGLFVSLCGSGASRHCRISSLAWDPDSASGTWSAHAPTGFAPVGRAGAVIDIDEEGQRVLVFGGERDDGPARDGWALAVGALPEGPVAFSRLGKDDDTPRARAWACGAVDPVGHRFFVVGGSDEAGTVDTLTVLDLEREDARWKSLFLPALPPAREGCAAAYDPRGARILVGFGRDLGVEHNDLWALEL